MLPKFRKCDEVAEFLDKINSIQAKEEKLLVWTSVENARTVAHGEIKLVFKKHKKIGLKVIVDDDLQDVGAENLYFYHEESASLFKGKIESIKNRSIEIIVEGNPFLSENRSVGRLEFQNVQYFMEVRTYRQSVDQFSNHRVTLKNISEAGIAFTIGAGRAFRFQRGDSISLTKVEKTVLPRPISGKIAHVTPLKVALGTGEFSEFSKAVLVGVQFEKASALIGEILKGLKKSA